MIIKYKTVIVFRVILRGMASFRAEVRRTGVEESAMVIHCFFSFLFTVCFNFKTAKFSSNSVEVSSVCMSSPKRSAMISPDFSISDF